MTDGRGQYLIVDLRPGEYTVTLSLPGFSTVRREGLMLAGSATLAIDAELAVGTLDETVTVTGDTPVVDVQNTRQQAVLNAAVADAIPRSVNPRCPPCTSLASSRRHRKHRLGSGWRPSFYTW